MSIYTSCLPQYYIFLPRMVKIINHIIIIIIIIIIVNIITIII